MGGPPPPGSQAAGVLSAAPLLGRKKELADILRLLREGAEHVTITGPPGAGKRRLAAAVIAEAPEARDAVRTSSEPLGLPGEHEYPLRPLAEAPAVELLRALSGDEETPYRELATLTLRIGRYPGALVEAAGTPDALRRLLRR